MKQAISNLLLGFVPAALLMGGVARAAEPAEPTVSATPTVRYAHVDGDENRFRHDWWVKDGLTGGLEELTIERKLKKDWLLNLSGRAIFDEEDYAVHLEIVNPNFGFVRAGYTEFRKYYDNSGGFFDFTLIGPAVAGPTMLEAGDDLHMDIGRIYAEIGLTLPKWPVLVLGYERAFKKGTKSMAEWGSVSEAGTGSRTRKIFPATKDVDETVDIFKVDVEHEIENVQIANSFRFEIYDMDVKRLDDGAFTFGGPVASNRTVTARETYQHDLFSNIFRMESHVNEKVFWSMGYLFLDSRGDAGIDIDTFNGLGQLLTVANGLAISRDRDQQTLFVDLDQNSHVLNGNVMFGPFFKKTTSFYGGIQAEKTETDGREAAELFEGTEAPAEANESLVHNDKEWFEERIGVRFSGIPFTTLYAEGKWNQGNIALFEEELVTNPPNPEELFLRYTDTDVSRQDYRVGFNTAPIRQLTLSSYYRHNRRENDYHGLIDQLIEDGEDVGQPGYSGFIDRQTLTTDEVGAKLTIRPRSNLSFSFKYQFVMTDTYTTFEDPTASNQTGDYKSSIYTVGATLVPIPRMFCSALFSYQDTRTIAQDNGSLAVATWRGDVYSVVGSVGYALDNKTDIRADYSFSTTDNAQPISLTGLDLGSDYTRHGLTVTLSRALRHNVLARLRYGFFDFEEDNTGGFNDYTAHLVAGSVTVRF